MINKFVSIKYLKQNNIRNINLKFKSAKPFSYLILKDFFNKDKLKFVLNEFSNLDFIEKNSDLYQFKQTNDLKINDNVILSEFYSFFSSSSFIDLISSFTGLKLRNTIDMSGFIYSKTDYLLPHDDQLEGRKIAYVVNLSKNFKRKDGGRLQIFSSRNNKPHKVLKSIIPEFNNLVLFEVSPISFHQVEEVFTNKERVSLAGWFHGY